MNKHKLGSRLYIRIGIEHKCTECVYQVIAAVLCAAIGIVLAVIFFTVANNKEKREKIRAAMEAAEEAVAEEVPVEEVVDHGVELLPHGKGLAEGSSGTLVRLLAVETRDRSQGTFHEFEDFPDRRLLRVALQAVAAALAADAGYQPG